jgi:hypothetical protein
MAPEREKKTPAAGPPSSICGRKLRFDRAHAAVSKPKRIHSGGPPEAR